MPHRLHPFVSARRAVAAIALVGLVGLMDTAGASTPAASAQPAVSGSPVRAASPVAIPSTCRAAATIVRPDTTLSLGVVQGATGKLYSTGMKLGYLPKAIAYLGTSTNRGITIDRFFAVHPGGDLRRVTVTERARSGGGYTASLDDTLVGRGWGIVRTMVSSGPYLYAVTTSGAFKRYAITQTYGVTGAGTVAAKGWGGVRSLAFGGWWSMPGGERAEDIVALTRTGEVKAYVIPRDKPVALTAHTLKTGGWGIFTHLAVGECSTGKGRALVGIKANGDVFAYLDTDADDQRGTDVLAGPRVARGWTGVVAD